MTGALSTLLDRLADEMAQTHDAMLAFDGRACAVHAHNEAVICTAIERTARRGSAQEFGIPPRLIDLVRQRKTLLPSTQRTVRALLGVCAAQRGTYEALY